MDVDRIGAPEVGDGFSELNRHFARFVGRLAGDAQPELTVAAALVSRRVEDGHVCLDLADVAGRPVPQEGDRRAAFFPQLEEWVRSLRASPMVGRPGDFRPLVLDDEGRLYLYRYWEYERNLADYIRSRAGEFTTEIDAALLREGLERHFPRLGPAGETDWQRVAALAALYRPFCVISGGPGTGKTTAVVKILALLLEQAGGRPLRIALTAPTGKAAARLGAAISSVRRELPSAAAVVDRIPEDVATVHRLLGAGRGLRSYRHDRDHPLPLDVVVVDEASMVDLPLMAKLVQALPAHGRLILLGDKDQLASVQAGAVLGDICGGDRMSSFTERFAHLVARITGDTLPVVASDAPGAGLVDSVVLLRKSYRFDPTSGIGRVSAAVLRGAAREALGALHNGSSADLSWGPPARCGSLAGALANTITEEYRDFITAETPARAFDAFDRFQILCARRRGPQGVEIVNAWVERVLAAAGVIAPRGRWYRGRPVLVSRNDYQLGLFNGDVGVALPDPEADGELRVFFPGLDGTTRSVAPSRLPDHETAYALTVHKSQGSEYDRVMLLLPDRDSELLTRELVYTALTRAKGGIEVRSSEKIFAAAIARRIRRKSGLREVLWG